MQVCDLTVFLQKFTFCYFKLHFHSKRTELLVRGTAFARNLKIPLSSCCLCYTAVFLQIIILCNYTTKKHTNLNVCILKTVAKQKNMITHKIGNDTGNETHPQRSGTLGKFLTPEQGLFRRCSIHRTKFRPRSLLQKSPEVLQRSSSCSRKAALVIIVWCFIVGYVKYYNED